MASNRVYSFKRNPHMQIARKIVQTYNLRKEDIKKIKSDLKYLERGATPVYDEHIADIIGGSDGMQQLTNDQKITALNRHLESLIRWNQIVDDAYDLAVANIEDESLRRATRKALVRAYTDSCEQPFYLLAYPIDFPRSDYDERSRILLKYVLRSAGIMPYVRQIKFRPRNNNYVKKKQRIKDDKTNS